MSSLPSCTFPAPHRRLALTSPHAYQQHKLFLLPLNHLPPSGGQAELVTAHDSHGHDAAARPAVTCGASRTCVSATQQIQMAAPSGRLGSSTRVACTTSGTGSTSACALLLSTGKGRSCGVTRWPAAYTCVQQHARAQAGRGYCRRQASHGLHGEAARLQCAMVCGCFEGCSIWACAVVYSRPLSTTG